MLSKEDWKKLITTCDNLPETVKYSPAPPFVFIRQYALNHKDLTEKLEELEKAYSMRFKDIYAAINYLMKKDKGIIEHKNRTRIGFRQDNLNP